MSGLNPSSTSPRKGLPWQQRRPVSGTHRKSSSAGAPQSPPAQSSVATPTTPSSERASSPIASRSTQRISVSSLSQNFSAPATSSAPLSLVKHVRSNSSSVKGMAGTFAPQFFKSSDERRTSVSSSLGKGIAGESSDFSGRRWVWVRDPEKAFVKGEVLEDVDGMLTVRCEDGSVCLYFQIMMDSVLTGSV